MICPLLRLFLFFFNDPATTEIYTLSLHDALPIWTPRRARFRTGSRPGARVPREIPLPPAPPPSPDRKSTRRNSSHVAISYAVFCLKKKTPSRPHISHTNSPHNHQHAHPPLCTHHH